jgi:hypothetical protein
MPTPYYTQQQSNNAKPTQQQFALNANTGSDAAKLALAANPSGDFATRWAALYEYFHPGEKAFV